MTKWDDISFVVRSKNRKKVLEALNQPKTPTQLARELNLNVGFVSNIIIELLSRKLVECLSPNEKRWRFYTRSKKGEMIKKEISKPINSK